MWIDDTTFRWTKTEPAHDRRLSWQDGAPSMKAHQRAVCASSTKTQSPSPSPLRPGGRNCVLPLLMNGEPFTSWYSPRVGSYQRAVVEPASFDMSTVIVRRVGK